MISPMAMESTIGYKIRPSIKYLRIRIKDIGKKGKDKVLAHFSIPMDADFKVISYKT